LSKSKITNKGREEKKKWILTKKGRNKRKRLEFYKFLSCKSRVVCRDVKFGDERKGKVT